MHTLTSICGTGMNDNFTAVIRLNKLLIVRANIAVSDHYFCNVIIMSNVDLSIHN